MKRCTKCERHLPDSRFATKRWTNKDGSVTSTLRSQCRDCNNEANLRRYHNRPETKAAHKNASYRWRIKSYGMTPEQYDDMLDKQGGVCAICEEVPEKQFNIDHCHKTGKVRSLLCGYCNNALGFAREDKRILSKMLEYLDAHS